MGDLDKEPPKGKSEGYAEGWRDGHSAGYIYGVNAAQRDEIDRLHDLLKQALVCDVPIYHSAIGVREPPLKSGVSHG
jgi:hypothetical protein